MRHEEKPLIGKLLEYFSCPVNYTLTAYVCKVLLALLLKKPNKVRRP